jgi:hypothetical protein
MTTAALKMLFEEPAVHELGVVLARSGRTARIRTSTGETTAEIAASCLLSPGPGDRVLVVRAGDEGYVLSVLKQSPGDEAKLLFDRDVSIGVLGGHLRLMATDGVVVSSPQTLKVEVDTLQTTTQKTELAFSALELVGGSILAKSKKIRVVAETFDTIASRIYQRAVNFLRRTDELDRVEAKNVERRAAHLFHLHAENAITTAEHLVKIDAAQVHVG